MQNRDKYGIYLHIPYCRARCRYCDFYTAPGARGVPREYVEGVSDELYSLGIHSFWNFSHYDITMKHPDAIVENVHMNDSLMTLSYKLALAEAGDSGQAAG